MWGVLENSPTLAPPKGTHPPKKLPGLKTPLLKKKRGVDLSKKGPKLCSPPRGKALIVGPLWLEPGGGPLSQGGKGKGSIPGGFFSSSPPTPLELGGGAPRHEGATPCSTKQGRANTHASA